MQPIHQLSPDPRGLDPQQPGLRDRGPLDLGPLDLGPLDRAPLSHRLILPQICLNQPLHVLHHRFLKQDVQLRAVHGLGTTVPVLTTEAHY